MTTLKLVNISITLPQFLKIKLGFIFKPFVVCVYLFKYVPCVQVPWRPEEGVSFPRAGVTIRCEQSDVWVLGKSGRDSQLPSRPCRALPAAPPPLFSV